MGQQLAQDLAWAWATHNLYALTKTTAATRPVPHYGAFTPPIYINHSGFITIRRQNNFWTSKTRCPNSTFQ